MSIVPNDRLGKLEFYEAHLEPWGEHAANIGITQTQLTGLTTLTNAARAAYNAAEAARNASKAATQDFYDAVRAMHSAPDAGQDMINDIKNYAESKDDPKVYVLAQIPPPAAPGAVPPPGTPFDFNVTLLQSGALELKWKCNNPPGASGTVYEIQRRLAEGAWTTLSPTGTRAFIDSTIPAGGSPVMYQITGFRSTLRGMPATFTVMFGVGGNGATLATITPAVSMNGKAAA